MASAFSSRPPAQSSGASGSAKASRRASRDLHRQSDVGWEGYYDGHEVVRRGVGEQAPRWDVVASRGHFATAEHTRSTVWFLHLHSEAGSRSLRS